ncbi:hypothetical protein VPH35_110903 [Triticum aestivum]
MPPGTYFNIANFPAACYFFAVRLLVYHELDMLIIFYLLSFCMFTASQCLYYESHLQHVYQVKLRTFSGISKHGHVVPSRFHHNSQVVRGLLLSFGILLYSRTILDNHHQLV